MKVVFIYRKRVSGANSIEELFANIAKQLKDTVEIVEYELRGYKYLLADIFKIRRLKADVYHVTGDVHYVVNLLPWHKTVLTIHDIYHYQLKLHGVKKFIFKLFWLTLPVRSATKITAISQETKEILIKEVGRDLDIRLIQNCYNEEIFKPYTKEYNTQLPTILHIGTKVNKNLPRLISALHGLNCKLVIIGVLSSHDIELLEKNAIKYHNVSNISIEEVYQYYCEADIVSFISLREGFGVPIIEANATGRIVITSNRDPMKTVANKSALLVSPESINAIRDGFLNIMHDEKLRTELIERGFKNALNYSSATIANQYYQVYNEIVTDEN